MLPTNHIMIDCNGHSCEYYRCAFMFQGCCHDEAWGEDWKEGFTKIRPIYKKVKFSPDWCPKTRRVKVYPLPDFGCINIFEVAIDRVEKRIIAEKMPVIITERIHDEFIVKTPPGEEEKYENLIRDMLNEELKLLIKENYGK